MLIKDLKITVKAQFHEEEKVACLFKADMFPLEKLDEVINMLKDVGEELGHTSLKVSFQIFTD